MLKIGFILVSIIFLSCRADETFNKELDNCVKIELELARKHEPCIDCYRTLVKNFPNEITAYDRLARAYINNNACDSALLVLNAGLKIDSTNFGLLEQRLLVQYSLDIEYNKDDLKVLELQAKERFEQENKYDWYFDLGMLYGIIYSSKKAIKFVQNSPIPQKGKIEIEKYIEESLSGGVHSYCGKRDN